jgi:hypothetical protein
MQDRALNKDVKSLSKGENGISETPIREMLTRSSVGGLATGGKNLVGGTSARTVCIEMLLDWGKLCNSNQGSGLQMK